MNINGGGISFEVSGTNEKLLKVLEQSRKSIKEFSTDAVKGGKGIDTAFNAVMASIQKAYENIDGINEGTRKQLEALREEFKKLSNQIIDASTVEKDEAKAAALEKEAAAVKEKVHLYENLLQQGAKVRMQLEEEESKLKANKAATEENVTATRSLRTQLRECREQLVMMEQNGQRGTEAFKRLQEEAGRLTDAIGDATQQAKILGHDDANLQGFISGVNGLVGAFTAAQGAASLFVGENENLQKAMLKVQSLMSISMGLQEVFNTINKDSAFMLTTVAKAKDFLTAANARLAAALGISTAAAQALMATLTLGLTAAITAIIVLFSKMSSQASKAAEEQKKFNDAVAKAAAKPLSSFMQLKTEWENLTNSFKEKEKWVRDNADKFEELGLKIEDARQAEIFFTKYTSDFVASCIAKAKALAAQQIAAEKYEEILRKQAEIESMPKTVKTPSVVVNGAVARTEDVANPARLRAKEELKQMKASAQKIMEMSVSFSKEEQKILAGIGGMAKKTIQGSVDAVQEEITRLQAQYNRATSDDVRKDLADKIAKQQAELSRISLSSGGTGSKTTADKDPYMEMLQKRKTAYAKYSKWAQSEDATVREAASKEFAEILKEGSSYLDYLEKQRDTISAKATKTGEDLQKLTVLNNEIAETTKQTVLSDFETKLNEELRKCETIGKRLELLAKRRGELAGDNSDVDNSKATIINDLEKEVAQQAKEETRELLRQYAAYTAERIKFEESYARKRELLQKAIDEATNESDRKIAEEALANLKKKQQEYAQQSDSEQYNDMLTRYRNYQQQITDIRKKYGEERALAEKEENFQMIEQINKAEQEELSKVASDKLMNTDAWSQLFSDLTKLTRKTLRNLIEEVNSKKVELRAQFNPADLKAINEQLEKAENELSNRDPFATLRKSLKDLQRAMKADRLLSSEDPFIRSLLEKKQQYKEYTDAINAGDKTLAAVARKEFAGLLKEGSSYIDNLKRKIADLEDKKINIGLTVEDQETLNKLNILLDRETGAIAELNGDNFMKVLKAGNGLADNFQQITGSMKDIADMIGNEDLAKAAEVIDDVMGNFKAAEKGAESWGGWWGAIIGGVTDLIPKLSSWFSGDKALENQIREHAIAVKKLQSAYSDLDQQIKTTFGKDKYAMQKELIENLREQKDELNQMVKDELRKKKTDQAVIAEYQEQIKSIDRQIKDIMTSVSEDVVQTSVEDLSHRLADALAEAFKTGEDAAEAFGEVANEVLQDAVKNALRINILEKPINTAIKNLQREMGITSEGEGVFTELSDGAIYRFKHAIQKAGESYEEAMKVYKDLFDQIEDTGDPDTLSGAIKGASQESIDLLAGQANAVRVNQVTSLDVLRQQLSRLSNIDTNVGVIAGRLLTIINKLTTPSDDGLRGQGLKD